MPEYMKLRTSLSTTTPSMPLSRTAPGPASLLLLACLLSRPADAQLELYCELDNCYDVLGVYPESNEKTIRRAYRKLGLR